MTAQEMWDIYQLYNPRAGIWSAWSFGDHTDELAQLVLRGVKTASSSLAYWYDVQGEPLPQSGTYSVVLDRWDQAVCVIQTMRVYTVPFDQVSEEHAVQEGEGDRSLAYWRRTHEAFFRAELAEAGLDFSPSMEVVCEEFLRVWPDDTMIEQKTI